MGSIPIEELLPRRPDQASEIGGWRLPPTVMVMRVGFNRRPEGPIVFENEIEAAIQLREREWRYRYPADNPVVTLDQRWRLELLVEANQPYVRPQQLAVVAQEPYGNGWLQTAIFKMYSKKNKAEMPEPEVPQLKKNEDPVDWLERNGKYDLWENSARYVAGIGFPNGFHEEPENKAGDFIFGTCPDFEGIVAELLNKNQEILEMLRQTEANQIIFWYKPEVDNPPRLYPEVIVEAESLMGLSIQQALAGPRHSSEDWYGQEVSKLVRFIYCDHLNALNKVIQRRHGHEQPLDADSEQ